jgi:hypothetical protein
MQRNTKLRIFEKRELRRIFGPKWDEEAGDWRGLHTHKLHNLYLHQTQLE